MGYGERLWREKIKKCYVRSHEYLYGNDIDRPGVLVKACIGDGLVHVSAPYDSETRLEEADVVLSL